MMKRRIFEVIC